MKENPNTIEKYKDIIYKKHPTSMKHPRMSMESRAAQFAPFAALTGHDASIRETARLTHRKLDISQEEQDKLNLKFQIVEDHMEKDFVFTFTFFVPDLRKDGGAYISKTDSVKKIDFNQGHIILNNNEILNIKDIVNITGEIFSKYNLD